MPRPPIRAIAVVVPIRDEEALLERCILGIEGAAAWLADRVAPEVRVVPVLALDSCQDGSGAIAERSSAEVLEIEVGNVGLARAAGVLRGLALLEAVPREEIWIANTDADSFVPRDWLAQQLALADAGWDVVLGRVQPDLADLPEELHGSAAAAVVRTGEPIYGANLGVRASSYVAAGGFPAAREHEDQRLVAALRRAGARVTASIATPVLTSGRVEGRTPGGYAGYLRDALAGA